VLVFRSYPLPEEWLEDIPLHGRAFPLMSVENRPPMVTPIHNRSADIDMSTDAALGVFLTQHDDTGPSEDESGDDIGPEDLQRDVSFDEGDNGLFGDGSAAVRVSPIESAAVVRAPLPLHDDPSATPSLASHPSPVVVEHDVSSAVEAKPTSPEAPEPELTASIPSQSQDAVLTASLPVSVSTAPAEESVEPQPVLDDLALSLPSDTEAVDGPTTPQSHGSKRSLKQWLTGKVSSFRSRSGNNSPRDAASGRNSPK
jgi:hypothetical protein